MSTQQKYISMPNNIALELVRTFLQPGMPTLGMWFGWNQPEFNSSAKVKLGSAYGSCGETFYWEEVFGDRFDGITGNDATLEDKKDFIRLMRRFKKNPRSGFQLHGIWSADEVFIPYNEMDIQHQMMYRLMVMSVNTGGEQHNWSIEFGEMLADWYHDQKSATCEWELYEADEQFTSEFVERFGHLIDLNIYHEETNNYPEGIVDKAVNEDTLAWVEDAIENFNMGDFYLWMFGVASNNYTYWHKEVDSVLVWFVDWMKDEWKSGNLQLTPDSPSDKLNYWLKWVDTQPTLPLFEDQ